GPLSGPRAARYALVVASRANDDRAKLERQLARLANERSALFDKASANAGLARADRERLQTVERELDECFVARRTQRAALDAQRFDREQPFLRHSGRSRRRDDS